MQTSVFIICSCLLVIFQRKHHHDFENQNSTFWTQGTSGHAVCFQGGGKDWMSGEVKGTLTEIESFYFAFIDHEI